MLIRWTIPRFRFDQLMGLAWKVMIPLALVNLVCVMVVQQFELPPWVLTAGVGRCCSSAAGADRGARPAGRATPAAASRAT